MRGCSVPLEFSLNIFYTIKVIFFIWRRILKFADAFRIKKIAWFTFINEPNR